MSFWQRRVIAPIAAQLRQGITPDQISLTLALGAVLGVFPILGSSTLLCGVAAWRLKLNQPVMQTVNYLVYPLQLILLLPFYRAGETLFGQPHVPIFSLTELIARFRDGPVQFLADYGRVGVYGIVVWLLLAPLVALMLYHLLRPSLCALARRLRPADPAAHLFPPTGH